MHPYYTGNRRYPHKSLLFFASVKDLQICFFSFFVLFLLIWMAAERFSMMFYLAVGGRRLSVLLGVMQLSVQVLEHVLVAFLCVHNFLHKRTKGKVIFFQP